MFERAVGSRWIVSSILAAALLSLFKCFNGNFVAATRLMFAMARRGLLDARAATVHPMNRTPSTAVLAVGAATALCMFLGTRFSYPCRRWARWHPPADGSPPALPTT